MKRVLIFSLAYYPRFVGGAEVAIKEITDRIGPQDIEFHLITLRFDAEAQKQEKIGNVIVHRVGWGRKHLSVANSFSTSMYIDKVLYVPLAALKAIQLRRKFNFDGMWAMMAYMVFPIVLMRMYGVRIPYILSIQEGDPFERVFERLRIRLFSPLLFYGIRHASVVQPISSFLGEWARTCGFAGPLEIIPNAVDVKHFTQTYPDGEIERIKTALGKKPGDIFLITTSRLVPKNAVDDVIRALSNLPKHVHFAVLGDGPEKEPLQRFAKARGVADRVHFFGHVDHGVMPKYLKAADIFIRPSRSEGFGSSFSEAMAAGLPIIATQEGGLADFLFDEKRNPDKETTGWAVSANAPHQIVQAVEAILDHPEKVAHVTANARKLVMEKYDWDIIARDMRTKVFGRVFGE